MPISIQIDEEGDLLAALNRIKNAATGAAARRAAGAGMANVVREHLYDKDNREPNKLGSTDRTHFYRTAGESTNFRISSDAITIYISEPVGIRQRYKGGRIKPGPGKEYLTIPIHHEAHGKKSQEQNLSFIYRRKAGAGLTIFLGKDQGEGGVVFYYVLKPEVYQEGDPTVLPEKREVLAAGVSAVEDFLYAQQNYATNAGNN